jgi:hypothetical protein
MPNISVPAINVTITAATASALTCADTTGLYVGQRGWAVKSDSTGNLEVIIVDVTSGTQFLCQTIANIANSGGADLSLYNGGKVYFDTQLVEVPGGGSDLSSLDTISVNKVPAKTATGFANATLDNVPDSATRLAVSAAQSSAVGALAAAGGVPFTTWRAVSNTTGSVAAGDNSQGIECTNASATTITVPSGLMVPFCVTILNSTDDAVRVAAGSGVTINSPGSALRVVSKNQPIVLIAKSANVFQAFGPMVA